MSRVLLDLFCGAGGASRGYADAGFTVVGIDNRLQPHYPYPFIQGDALDVSLWPDRVDVIHASPPCQRYSTMSQRWNGRAETHPDLIEPTRTALRAAGVPYVIENVPGAPLIEPALLCGSMFGLGVRRHRLFEADRLLFTAVCRHASQPPKYWTYDHGKWHMSPVAPVYGHGGGKAKDQWSEAMDIDWMTVTELAQAIPPAYTRWIGAQL
jgi:DNA (cytosine-5)-methyltransferase 1